MTAAKTKKALLAVLLAINLVGMVGVVTFFWFEICESRRQRAESVEIMMEVLQHMENENARDNNP